MCMAPLEPVRANLSENVGSQSTVTVVHVSGNASRETELRETAQRPRGNRSGVEQPQAMKTVDNPEWTPFSIPQKPIPASPVRSKFKSQDAYANAIEYDVDDEDYLFLKMEMERRDRQNESPLTADDFEKTLDRLEKETLFQPTRVEPEVENDDVCCVCNDGEVSNVNQIIYCDMCNIAVHQECYGVPYIPEGQWLCRKCKLSPSQPISCELCPLQNGAFKPTSDNKWGHVVCAIWLNEVHFSNIVFLEPIEGVQNSLKRRAKLRCLVCRLKTGACLQCSTRSCTRSFHVTCAILAQLHMVTETEPTVKVVDAIHRARRSVQENRSHAPSISIPLISPEARERIVQIVGKNLEETMLYWYYKRRLRSGVPLIRRLQACTRAAARNAAMSEATEEQLLSGRGRVVGDRVRLLCELVKRREKNKKFILEHSHKLFENVLKPPELLYPDLIKALRILDTSKVFAAPVRIRGYESIIKNPMDLGTMLAKAESGEYSDLTEIRADLDLMFANCAKFNKNNTYFLKYGKKMRKEAETELRAFEQFLKERESAEWLSEVTQMRYYAEEEGGGCQPGSSLEEFHEEEVEEPEEVKKKEEKKTHPIKRRKGGTAEQPQPKKRRLEENGFQEDIKESRKTKGVPEQRGKDLFSKRVASPMSASKSPSSKRAKLDKELRHAPFSAYRAVSLVPPISSIKSSLDKGQSLRDQVTATQLLPAAVLYREVSAILSPAGPEQVSCDSSAEDDVRKGEELCDVRDTLVSPPTPLSFSDPDSLHHGDLVKVEAGSRSVAGMVLEKRQCALDSSIPDLSKSFPGSLPPSKVLVRLLNGNGKIIDCYDRSKIRNLNTQRDKCEGIEEARRIFQSVPLVIPFIKKPNGYLEPITFVA